VFGVSANGCPEPEPVGDCQSAAIWKRPSARQSVFASQVPGVV
jgi:hypothetical protein